MKYIVCLGLITKVGYLPKKECVESIAKLKNRDIRTKGQWGDRDYLMLINVALGQHFKVCPN